MFRKSELLCFTHILFLQSQHIILLFDGNNISLSHLSVLQISTVCMFFYRLLYMKNDVIEHTHRLKQFLCCFVVQNHAAILHCVHKRMQSTFSFSFKSVLITKQVLLHFLSIQHIIHQPNIIILLFFNIQSALNLISIRFVDFLKWLIVERNHVIGIFDSRRWLLCWFNFDQHFQCRHLHLLNRFWALGAMFIWILCVEVVLAWSDKKTLKTKQNHWQTQRRK